MSIISEEAQLPNLKGQNEANKNLNRMALALEALANEKILASTEILNDYVLSMLKDNTDVKTYNAVREYWFKARGAGKLSGTTSDTDSATLTGLVDEFYKLTRKLVKDWDGWARFAHPDVSSASEGTKMGSNANMVCVPSTDTVAGRDDFAGNPLFAVITVNWVIVNKNPVITAIKGISSDFEQNNPAKYVGVVQMSGYHHWTEEDESGEYYIHGYCAKPNFAYSHIEPLPEAVNADGTVREWVIHGKYQAGVTSAGLLTNCSGQRPKENCSHDNLHASEAKNGVGYSGTTSADMAFLLLMLYIKYGSLASDGILNGTYAYYLEYEAQVAETGVRRIILPASAYGALVAKSRIYAGTWDGKVAHDSINQYHASAFTSISGTNGTHITNVEKVTINSTEYCAIYLDTDSTFNTTIRTDDTGNGATKVWTALWDTGSTDTVLGNDGSLNPTDAKHPSVLQGIEFGLGQWEVLADVILKLYQEDGDTENYYYTPYIVKDTEKHASTIGDDYSACDVKLKGTESWQYIKHFKYSNGYFFPDSVGGSSSTYTKDAIYTNKATGTREVIAFGRLDDGLPNCGLSCFSGSWALGNTWWSLGGRLSPNGCRGVWGVSPQTA